MSIEAVQALERVEKHIQQCGILAELLSDRLRNVDIDYTKYIEQGYREEDISIGIELVNLYLILKDQYRMSS